MNFISIPFFLFFITVLFLFYSVGQRYRNSVLLMASFVFISLFSINLLLYAILFSIINYFIGISVSQLTDSRRRYVYLTGQFFNIGGLIFFKYINFIFESFNNLVSSVLNFQIPYLNVIVPIGISYYTFQGISYLYLINKAKDKPERNFINFALYMLFFPKLLAGPIERHRILLPQINRKKSIDTTDITIGIRLFLWGALKKTVIADVLFVIVDTGMRDVINLSGIKSLFVFLLLPVYMYFDF